MAPTRARTGLLLAAFLFCVTAACAGGPEDDVDAGPGDAETSADADGGGAGLEVTSVQPTTGPVTGGTEVAVSGKGFASGASVWFGDNQAQQASVVSEFKIEATTPSSAGLGPVDVRVELPDGRSSTLGDGFEYTDDSSSGIGWCKLQHPPSMTVPAGSMTDPIFGRVFVEGCTDGDQECEQVVAEVGLGDPSTDPSATPGDYEWTTASYNPDHTSDDNDEHQAQVAAETSGTFAYVYRMKLSGESDWTYCDLDDSSNGFQTDQMGELTVEEASTDVSIDWCNLQFPSSITVASGEETPTVYGRVFSEGCTNDDSDKRVECEPISGQVGWGPTDVDPSTDPSSFDWADATYNTQFPPSDQQNDNDEHQATFTPMSTGDFSYLYRFSGDGGQTWTYCDLDGSPFSTDQLGALTVQ